MSTRHHLLCQKGLTGISYNNNGLFDLAATAGLDAQSTYILHIEPRTQNGHKHMDMHMDTKT